jgi:hypothetical protein
MDEKTYEEHKKKHDLEMSKILYTENELYIIFDVWYDDDDVFRHIARGQVKWHLANGLNLDGHFIMYIIELSNDGWYRGRKEA